MGTYNSTYVGVYMELPHVKSNVEYTVRIHPDTGKKMKNRYCYHTGKEGIKTIKTKKVNCEPSPYIEEHETLNEDEFFMPEYHGGIKASTFICNGGKYKITNEDDVFNFDFGSIDSVGLIADFKEHYKEYIKYYEEKYDTEVNVKFGVVHYAH